MLASRYTHKIFRQPAAELRVHQQQNLAVCHIGNRCQGGLQTVHGKSDMAAIEIAAHKRLARGRIKNRIVV